MPPRDPPPADAAVVDAIPGPRPILVDAAPRDAVPADQPIDVPALAMAGPYPSLRASCKAAKPCGELAVDDRGMATQLPTSPDCRAVLDPSTDPVTVTPRSYTSVGPGSPARAVPGGEIRIAGVVCAVPEGMHGDSADHYVFVKRDDGWWRTEAPLFTHNYNDKYCSGSRYVQWNVDAARTIVGLAMGVDCLSCGKQMMTEDVTELMLRIEPGGAKPRVFAPLQVGWRTNTTAPFAPADPAATDPDCKVGARAVSLQERWLADDEVVLTGPAVAVGTPRGTPFVLHMTDVTALARPGHYRFPRP